MKTQTSRSTGPILTIQAVTIFSSLAPLLLHGQAGDPCVPPPPGLIAWWSGDGYANDLVGANHGALQNGAAFEAGIVGEAFRLDGANDHALLLDKPSLRVQQHTIETWVKLDATTGDHQCIVCKPIMAQANNSIALFIHQAGHVHAHITTTGGTLDVVGPMAPVGAFFHVAQTFDGATLRLYVNGAFAGQTFSPPSSIVYDTSPVYLGIDFDGGTLRFPLKGLLDEVSIYNRALSASEIAAIYSAGSIGKCKPLNVLASGAPLIDPLGLALSPDGSTLFVSDATADAIFRLPATGGPLVEVASGGRLDNIRFLTISPDGTILYIAGWGRGEVLSLPVTGGTPTVLASQGDFLTPLSIAVSPDGSTLYVADNGRGAVFRVPSTGGSPISVLSGLGTGFSGPVALAISPDGNTLYVAGGFTGVFSVPAAGGTATPIAAGGGAPFHYAGAVSVSPDGTRLFVYDNRAYFCVGNSGFYSMSVTGGPPTLLYSNFSIIPAIYVLPSRDARTLFVSDTGERHCTNSPVVEPGRVYRIELDQGSSCVSPHPGLVSWWAGEGSGSDLRGINHGAPSNGVAFVPGQVGLGFGFDGTNGFVEIPNSASLSPPQFTLEAWAFIDPAVLTKREGTLVSKSYSSSVGGFWLGYQDLSDDAVENAVAFQVFGGTGQISEAKLENAFPTPGFYHIASTFDGSRARLFLNGQLKATGAALGGMIQNSLTLRIGATHVAQTQGFQHPFRGTIDEVSFYEGVLDSIEIAAIYAAGSAGKCGSHLTNLCNLAGTWSGFQNVVGDDSAPYATHHFGQIWDGFLVLTQGVNGEITGIGCCGGEASLFGCSSVVGHWDGSRLTLSMTSDPESCGPGQGPGGRQVTQAILFLSVDRTKLSGSFRVNEAGESDIGLHGSMELTGRAVCPEDRPHCVTAPLGIVSWWAGEGNANDHVSTNHAVPQNPTAFAQGVVGKGFKFEGGDDAVQTPAIFLGHAYSVEFWINPDAYPSASGGPLVANNWTSPNFGTLYLDADGTVAYWQNSLERFDSVTAVPLNEWTHVALAHDVSVTRLYLNGVLTATSLAYRGAFDNPLTFGHEEHRAYRGTLDEISLYSRALTSSEVQAIYAAGSVGKCKPNRPVLLVSSYSQSSILRYDQVTGDYLGTFVAGLPPNSLFGLVFGRDGHLYLGDSVNKTILRFDGQTGIPLGVFATNVAPYGMTLGLDGHLYVCSGDRVLVIDGTTGVQTRQIGSGNLQNPVDVVFGPDGFVYVADRTHGVVRFDSMSGMFMGIFCGPENFSPGWANGIAFGPDGNLYVTDGGNKAGRVLRFNGVDGSAMGVFASGGGLWNPVGLRFGPDGHLYVVSNNYGGGGTQGVIRYDGVTGALIDQFATGGIADQWGVNFLAFTPSSSICVPPPSGLLGWWSGDANAADHLGNNGGSVQNGTAFVAGRLGQAFSFDGVDDYVDVGSGLQIIGDMTLAAWLRTTNTGIEYRYIAGSRSPTTHEGWEFVGLADGTIRFQVAGRGFATGQTSVRDGQWHYVAGVRAGAEFLVYVDGRLEGQSTGSLGGPASGVATYIGKTTSASDALGRRWQGLIDEFQIYDRALAGNEVAAIYAAGSAGICKPSIPCVSPPAGLLDWWPGDGHPNDIAGTSHGILRNGASFGPGIVGTAFALDGMDDYVDIGQLPQLANAHELTVMAWVYWTNTASVFPAIVSKWHTTPCDGSNSFSLYTGEGGTRGKGTFFLNFNNNTCAYVVGTNDLPVGEWVFVAATWRNTDGTMVLYKNGAADATITGAGVGREIKFHTAFPAKIGDWGFDYGTNGRFGGLIDEVAIFARALSSNEIAAIYAAGSAGVC